MEKYIFRQKVKSLLSFLCILVLLPYVVTVFMNGSKITSAGNVKAAYIYFNNGERQQQVLWEEYFVGVLAKEIAADIELEALKAQAVILRTSLYQELEQTKGNEVSMEYWSKEELEKKWGINYAEYYDKFQKAIRDTAGEVLMFNGSYAMVPFHQSSNGTTRNASEVWGTQEYPYLTMKECPEDKEAEEELHIYRLPYQEIQEKCQADFVAVEEETAKRPLTFADFEIKEVDSAGYVTKLRIRNTILSGEQFRQSLALASSAFSIKDGEDDELVLTATGNGHGLGMSQWSANKMAEKGNHYSDILAYFFEGIILEDAGEIFTKLE